MHNAEADVQKMEKPNLKALMDAVPDVLSTKVNEKPSTTPRSQ